MLEAIADLAVVACHNAEAYDDVRTAASTDALTGLLNHGAMQVRVREEIARAARDGQPLCCVLIDLDDFKRVNDELGHPAGDALLRRVADALRAEVRPYDQVARYGGDEFVLVLPGTDGAGRARRRRARPRRASAPARRRADDGRSATARSASPPGSRRWTPTTCSPPPTARCCWPSAPARAASRSPTPTPRRSWRGCSAPTSRPPPSTRSPRRSTRATTTAQGSSEQVVRLATSVAMLLGLTADAVERIGHGALLHDVGKLAIPDEILRKDGTLDDAEWDVMAEHPVIGEEHPAPPPPARPARPDRPPRARALGRQRLPRRARAARRSRSARGSSSPATPTWR